ncbi:N-acetyltransferase family protein [Promethearchaeum syntrophicum]|uniref:N-acetyltransferase family protein n=1 Tax=Promethearchaeum syntrophicum TaxID=2594042 RepID=A0A5B9D988_9ARCH|nr:GNAT family protein [Candidatus Prometheoarchaeum syntrophicum]QEE15642.1 putative acetyltransferase YhhY [Candidatus Prometheoarchaeum syntrophicum]
MSKKIILKNGKEIYLRLIEKDDLEGIWSNFNEVVEEKIYLPVYTPVLNQWEKNSWYKDLIQINNFCIVAVDIKLSSPKKIVGQLTIEHTQWEAAKHVGILGIIVQKKYRNLGLGYFLIELGKEIAKERGKKKLILSTFDTNKQGIKLYKKCGFKIVGTYEKQYFINGNYVNEILMENRL